MKKRITIILFLFLYLISSDNTIKYNYQNYNIKKQKEIDTIVETSNDEALEEILLNYDNLMDDLLGSNVGTNKDKKFEKTYDENGKRVLDYVVDFSKCEYSNSLIDYYNNFDSKTNYYFNNICNDDNELNNFKICLNNKFDINKNNFETSNDYIISSLAVETACELNNNCKISNRYPFNAKVQTRTLNDIDLEIDNPVKPIIGGGTTTLNVDTVAEETYYLSQVLEYLGVSISGIMAIKSAIYEIISVIKNILIPKNVKIILLTLGVGIITTVCLVYWNQINAIINAIFDCFLNIATSLINCLKELFDKVIDRGNTTISTGTYVDKENKEWDIIEGDVENIKILNLADQGCEEIWYHYAFIPVDCKKTVLISTQRIDQDEAINALKNNKNVYTKMDVDAKYVIEEAYPNLISFDDCNEYAPSGEKIAFVLPHYHVCEEILTDDNGNKKYKNKRRIHSFFGTPVLVMAKC